MIELIKGVVQLILLVISMWYGASQEDKKKKQELINELQKAIKEGDTSNITAILSGLR